MHFYPFLVRMSWTNQATDYSITSQDPSQSVCWCKHTCPRTGTYENFSHGHCMRTARTGSNDGPIWTDPWERVSPYLSMVLKHLLAIYSNLDSCPMSRADVPSCGLRIMGARTGQQALLWWAVQRVVRPLSKSNTQCSLAEISGRA